MIGSSGPSQNATNSGPSTGPQNNQWLQRRIRWLKWLLPAALFIFVVVFEIGPSRWIDNNLGESYHFLVEVLIYGTVGPLLAFALLDFLNRWLEERETSELQAQLLARARAQAETNHKLNDDTLQVMFATSVLLSALETHTIGLSPESTAHLQEAQRALNQTIQHLHAQLLGQSAPKKQERQA